MRTLAATRGLKWSEFCHASLEAHEAHLQHGHAAVCSPLKHPSARTRAHAHAARPGNQRACNLAQHSMCLLFCMQCALRAMVRSCTRHCLGGITGTATSLKGRTPVCITQHARQAPTAREGGAPAALAKLQGASAASHPLARPSGAVTKPQARVRGATRLTTPHALTAQARPEPASMAAVKLRHVSGNPGQKARVGSWERRS